MTNGKGISAARARIEAAFRALHSDCRDREQVQADSQLRTSLAGEPNQQEQSVLLETECVGQRIRAEFERVHTDLAQDMAKPARVEKSSLTKTEQQEREFHVRSKYLCHAALRSVHIHSRVLPRDLHQCYVVEVPTETASELFVAALRRLEGK
jgi:hypothetical protein